MTISTPVVLALAVIRPAREGAVGDRLVWIGGVISAREVAWLTVGQPLLTHVRNDSSKHPPSAGGRDLLGAATGLECEPGARHPTGLGPRRHDRGHTLDGPGAPRGLSRLCHPERLDGLARHGHTGLAPGVVAQAAPGPPAGTANVARHRAGRSWSVCPVAGSAHHPAGVAPVWAHQHRRDVSSAG